MLQEVNKGGVSVRKEAGEKTKENMNSATGYGDNKSGREDGNPVR